MYAGHGRLNSPGREVATRLDEKGSEVNTDSRKRGQRNRNDRNVYMVIKTSSQIVAGE